MMRIKLCDYELGVSRVRACLGYLRKGTLEVGIYQVLYRGSRECASAEPVLCFGCVSRAREDAFCKEQPLPLARRTDGRRTERA